MALTNKKDRTMLSKVNFIWLVLLYWITPCFLNFVESVGNNIIVRTSNEHVVEVTHHHHDNVKPIKRVYTANELHELRQNYHDKRSLRELPFGVVKRVRQLGINRSKLKSKLQESCNHRTINRENLIYIKSTTNDGSVTNNQLTISTLNVRSLKPKEDLIHHEITHNNIDCCLLTETWLSHSPADLAWIQSSAFNNRGLTMTPVNRQDRRGGGVALVTTNVCDQKLIKEFSITECECALWSVMTKIGPCYILGIYRPPQTSIPIFVDELTDILVTLKVQYTNIIVLGDFNIHIHDFTNNDSVLFLSTMEALGFDQHIQKPTHVRGNTLDSIFTSTSNKLEIAEVDVGTFISDHARVSVLFTMAKQRPHKTTIEKRESKNLTSTEVMQEFDPPNINLKGDLNHTHNQFNNELQRVMDKLAPMTKKNYIRKDWQTTADQ